MDLDEARQFIRENHNAVLATLRPDGRPQLTPVLATVDGEGRITVSTREWAAKVRNLRRDPRATVAVLSPDFYGRSIYVDGTAEVLSLPDAMEPLVDYYRSVSGEHPDWDDYRADMERDQRVLIRITPERAGPG